MTAPRPLRRTQRIAPDAAPPHDADLEQAFLGCALLDGAIVDPAHALGVSGAAFYLERHRLAWEALASQVQMGRPTDLVAITDRLRELGLLEGAGGPAYLTGLLNAVPTAANWEYYARRLLDLLHRRGIIEAATEAIRVACNIEGGPPEAIEAHRIALGERLLSCNGAAPEAASPTIRRDGDDFTFTWPDHAIEVVEVRETSGGLLGEVTMTVAGRVVHWGRLPLASTSAREVVVRKLTQTIPYLDWRPMLERVCRTAALQVRAGTPVVVLQPAPPVTTRALVEQLLPLGETAVIYGDGGCGKSLLGLALGLAVCSGAPLPCGLRPVQQTHVLLLDWESTREEHEERLHGLVGGLGAAYAGGIHYRAMTRALADEASALRAEISRLGVGFVIVDSLGPACGPEPEGADAVIRTMNALRAFAPATRLVLAHVTKAAAEQRAGPARPYGSIYTWNLGRSVWEMRRADDDEDQHLMPVGLYHRKANRGRLHPPIGLGFDFGGGLICVRHQDLKEREDLLARTSLPYRIRAILSSGSRTVEDLAKEIDTTPDSIRRTLNRLKDQGQVLRLDDVAPGKAGRWGLAVR